MRLLVLVLLGAAAVANAGEYAVLSSGARLRVDRHEADGAKVRLYHDTGVVEMDAVLVKFFEPAASPEAAPAPQLAAVETPAPTPPEPRPAPTVFELADAA